MSYGISPLEKIWPTIEAVMRAQDFWNQSHHARVTSFGYAWHKPTPFLWHGNHVLVIWRFQFWWGSWCEHRHGRLFLRHRSLYIGYMKERRFGQVLRVVSFL